MSLLQQIAENLGATGSVGGSWMQTIAIQEGATGPVGGSWIQSWANAVGVTGPIGGSWIQAIADHYGVTGGEGDWLIGIEANTTGTPPPPPIDPDAQAFITASGISGIEADAINDLVLDLKADSLWDKMQAIWPFVGSTSATQKWNLLDPQDVDFAYRLTFEGAWTHDASGAEPDSNGWARTYIAPATNSFWSGITPTIGGHMSVNVIENAPGNAGYDMGVFGGSNNVEWAIISSFGNSTAYGQMDEGSFVTYDNSNTNGFYVTSNFEDIFNYKDGISKITAINRPIEVASSGDQEVALAASGRGPGSATAFSERKINFATIGYGLTDTDVTNLTNILSSYNATLSR
jgi:hypothetical protein